MSDGKCYAGPSIHLQALEARNEAVQTLSEASALILKGLMEGPLCNVRQSADCTPATQGRSSTPQEVRNTDEGSA